ncbi:hypothetical protein KJ570_02470 [Patescibacteria group bacterium]|nr:hypothetical protein [Patescibacteria group bacterium]MBU2035912.1 hypothetical protein [Patescibacteria group bacterium]
MNLIIKKKTPKKQLQELGKHFDGYIKVVVDIKKEILAGGADRYFEEEQKLLENGSKQRDLWGGGFDTKTKETDYNSIINLRPNQENPSRDILSLDIRKKFDNIVKKLFL